MGDFQRIINDDDYRYYKLHKLSNGQLISIHFVVYENSRNTEYWVVLVLANKKKHIKNFFSNKKDVLSHKETGRCGLEGLIWAKNQILEFESEYCYKGDKITVHWDDNRRRNVYEYGLKKIGFKIGNSEGIKCLYKIC